MLAYSAYKAYKHHKGSKASHQPAILLVTDAWHTPAHYRTLLDDLATAGFLARCPALPSSTSPAATFDADVQTIRDEAVRLADANHPVIVLAHGHAGQIATAAITPGLALARRNSDKKHHTGGVVRIVYLAAFLLDAGACVADSAPAYAPDSAAHARSGPGLRLATPREALFHDIDAGDAEVALDTLVPAPADLERWKPAQAGWLAVPWTYVHCTQDALIGLRWQEAMVQGARERGGRRDDCDKYMIECGHAAFLSCPGDVVKIVVKEWERSKPE